MATDDDRAARLVHVTREAVDHLAGELAEAEAVFRRLADVPEAERTEWREAALVKLGTVLRLAGAQFHATADAIAALVEGS